MRILAALLASQAPHAQPVAVAPAETLQVTDGGAGSPVVLVPGLFGSAFAFRNVVPPLVALGHRVIVIEPLGIGASTRPERADYSLTAQADRIAAVLDRLGTTKAVVVAHAVGASMAYRLAYRHPQLVRGIVALEGGPAEAAATPGFRQAMKLARWVKLFGGARLIRSRIHQYLIEASGDASWVSADVVSGYTAGAARDLDGTLKAYLAMAHAREPERLRSHLGEVRCPVHLLLGGAPHKGGPPAREIALLAQRLPVFTVDTLPGVGHFVHEEQREAVLAAVARFGTGAAPPSATAVGDAKP